MISPKLIIISVPVLFLQHLLLNFQDSPKLSESQCINKLLLLLFISGISLFAGFTPSPHTYQIVDAVIDALTSKSPRDRYLVGLDARFFFVWMARLPTVMSDFIVTRMLFRSIVPLGNK